MQVVAGVLEQTCIPIGRERRSNPNLLPEMAAAIDKIIADF